jgi:hypothetical protein
MFLTKQKAPKERFVELVIVHGMGMQKPGETLIEWAEPLLRRIDWIARRRPIGVSTDEPNGVVVANLDSTATRELIATLDDPLPRDSAVIFDGVLHTPSGPEVNARVPYLLDGEPRMLRLRITEAHWAESFLAMTRDEVFEWGAGFAARALFRIGRYFTWMSIYGARKHPWRAPISLVSVAAVWLVLVVLTGLLAITLPFVGPLFLIPGVKKVASPIMDTLAEFVGDAAVWTRRPVRAAALRDVVRTKTRAARDRLDARKQEGALIVLAHSEGATISADMLFSNVTGEPKVPVDGFVTVGAGITLLGPSTWAGVVKRHESDDEDREASHPLNLIRAWARNAPATTWLNYWGIWDPVPSGPISTGETPRRERWKRSFGLAGDGATYIGPREHAVHNTALPFTDHQSYSSNLVQVVDPVARLLMRIQTPDDSHSGEPDESARRQRLHVRGIQAIGTQRLLIVGVAALVFVIPAAFARVSSWIESLAAWARSIIAPAERDLIADDSAVSLAFLNEPLRVGALAIAFVVLALYLNSWFWKRYSSVVTWNPDAQVPTGPWVLGLVWRGVLAVLFAFVAGWLVHPQLGTGWWTALALFVAAYSVFAPFLARVPIAVPAARDEVHPL